MNLFKKGVKGSVRNDQDYFEVTPGVWGMRILFVNIFMIDTSIRGEKSWVLIDAALKGSSGRIIQMAEEIFGKDTPPSAIVLTHGHFDHVGALHELLMKWDVPVYAHQLEVPYLRGISSYPPPDPTVGGGAMAMMAWMYPSSPIDIGERLKMLPADGTLPQMPEWVYLHTPGHSPGHISLYRDKDKVLVAGDAFVTTKQESAVSVMIQKKELCGPPKYFTMDWVNAEHSVQRLLELNPEIAATGHGMPMYGEELKEELKNLCDHFQENAVPSHGRYVDHPAEANEEGVTFIPPSHSTPLLIGALAVAGLVGGYFLISTLMKKKHNSFHPDETEELFI